MRFFVISVIDKPGSQNRTYADELFNYIIKPAAVEAGFTDVMRGDQFSGSQIITTQIIEAIMNWELVVADLSVLNANVYYEIAIRHWTKRPIVHLAQTDVIIPFDVAAMRALQFDMSVGPATDARNELVKWIKKITAEPSKGLNPISLAQIAGAIKDTKIDNKELAEVVNQQFANMQASIARLQSEVAELRRPVRLGGLASLGGYASSNTSPTLNIPQTSPVGALVLGVDVAGPHAVTLQGNPVKSNQ
jgi:hypothetical protein